MRSEPRNAKIRIAILDDSPVVLAGLRGVLAGERELEAVGFAANEHELGVLLAHTRPDVLLLDLHHPGRDGLTLALELTSAPNAPRVVLYSASVDLVAAIVAGADAVVSKAADTRTVLDVLRAATREPRQRPQVSHRARARAAAELDAGDHAVLAMRLAGHAAPEIAETLGLPVTAIAGRIQAILATLSSTRARRAPQPARAGSAV